MYDERTNTRGVVLTTTHGLYITALRIKKNELLFSIGTGLEQIHLKCLYDIYPLKRHFYGSPVNIGISFFYNLNDKLALNLNAKSSYGFLFYNKNSLFVDSYYYKTFFYSLNLGIRYTFNKKQ